MIAVIDYGMGNIKSVINALIYTGNKVVVTDNKNKIKDCSHIVLPGVGAFGTAIQSLNERNLPEILNREVIEKGKPFFGICLGLQILASCSYEHGTSKGFGWLDAEVIRFDFYSEKSSLKIPHVGWSNIAITTEHPVFANLKKDQLAFYFVHSYHVCCKQQQNIAATCNYGYDFTAAVAKDNIFATQFHPEKSQDNGIQLLVNFVNWKP